MATKKLDFNSAKALKNVISDGGETNLISNYIPRADEEVFKKINFTINSVKKINNPYMFGIYLLHKEELMQTLSDTVEEKWLYHCTSPNNSLLIAKYNIDWRLTCRTRFGRGACFSNCPRYAVRYAGRHGAIVICRVLMKKVQCLPTWNYELIIPEEGYDTTVGNNTVYVKYDDYTFYPQYIVYY